MDTFYIREKNLCSQRIREKESYLTRAENNLKNIESKSVLTDFEKTQLEKQKTQIENYKDELNKLKERLENLKSRKLDSEYLEQLKQVVAPKKVEAVISKIPNNKPTYQTHNNYSPYKPSEKYMDKELIRFLGAYDAIPEKSNIKKNLAEMPNNKGYIWNNIWFFGELPAEPNKPIIMVEKVYNSNILRTYEYNDDYIYIYEKSGKESRKLVEKREYSNFHWHIKKFQSSFF